MIGKDDWMEEDQAIGEEFTSGEIDREDAARRLKDLGFDPLEIKDTLDELELNLAECPQCHQHVCCYECASRGGPGADLLKGVQ